MTGYRRVLAHSALAPCVESLWVQDPSSSNPPTRYAVLPKPCPVIGFQYRGRLSVIRDDAPQLLAPGGITGLQHTVRHFQPDADTRSVILILRPHAPFRLFGCPAQELSNQHIPLDALLTNRVVRSTIERLHDAPGTENVINTIQHLLLDCLARSTRDVHPAVIEATNEILASHGSTRIDRLAQSLDLSRRQLQRLFKLQVGVTPKEFASLARFDHAVTSLPRRRSWTDLAFEAGYADQSHFIRSFSRRAGTTPAQYQRDLPRP